MINIQNQNCNMKNFILILAFMCSNLVVLAEDVNSLILRAERGNATAQYDLACYYLNNTESNYTEVLRWLRKASKQKNENADRLIKFLIQDGYKSWGDYYLNPKYDFGAMSETMEKEAKKHITDGCGDSDCNGHKGNFLLLAHSYFHQEKYALAIYCYKQALSQMRNDNLGVKVMEGEKYENMDFTLACMDAYTMLGFCYEHGFGVQKDLQIAVDYYSLGGLYISNNEISKKYDVSGVRRILSECNNPDLYEICGNFTQPTEAGIWGSGTYDGYVPDPFAVRAWCKQGVMFLKMRKFDIAKDLFNFDDTLDKRISEIGCINALWVAEMYYEGLGVSVDLSKAYKLFNRIANEEGGPWGTPTDEYYSDIYADACYRLYECYTYGRGISKDANKATYYFKEALKNGSTSAIYDDQKRYEISLH